MPGNWMDDRERQMRERDTARRGEPYGGREDRSFGSGRPERYAARGGGPAPRFTSQDYTEGGRYYGDDGRAPIYREQYGQGGVYYGDVPPGYDAGRDRGRPYADRAEGDDRPRSHGEGRSTQRFEDASRQAGEFLHRAGERVASWFGGGEPYGPPDRGYRGRGPKDYKRPDERISDEAHERLTDDGWVDATNITISVSGGEVTLSGTVENRESKHRAERIIETIGGVTHVQNNLRVNRGAFLTSAPAGFGDSVVESQMRNDESAAP
jgi:osmotically-inducible protein OsmY